jgi:hypothetical protein
MEDRLVNLFLNKKINWRASGLHWNDHFPPEHIGLGHIHQ